MRSLISARFMAWETKLRRLIRGVVFGRGAGVRAHLATCVRRPFALKLSVNAKGVPSSGVGPTQIGTRLGGGIGSKIRAGTTTAWCNLFSVR